MVAVPMILQGPMILPGQLNDLGQLNDAGAVENIDKLCFWSYPPHVSLPRSDLKSKQRGFAKYPSFFDPPIVLVTSAGASSRQWK